MADLRVAFWNVQNLFEPGTSKYGPTDEPELLAKLDVIARSLDGLTPSRSRSRSARLASAACVTSTRASGTGKLPPVSTIQPGVSSPSQTGGRWSRHAATPTWHRDRGRRSMRRHLSSSISSSSPDTPFVAGPSRSESPASLTPPMTRPRARRPAATGGRCHGPMARAAARALRITSLSSRHFE